MSEVYNQHRTHKGDSLKRIANPNPNAMETMAKLPKVNGMLNGNTMLPEETPTFHQWATSIPWYPSIGHRKSRSNNSSGRKNESQVLQNIYSSSRRLQCNFAHPATKSQSNSSLGTRHPETKAHRAAGTNFPTYTQEQISTSAALQMVS